jgi:hypothetical protein
MKHRLLTIALVISLALLAAAAGAQSEAKSLFNGKDLAGWEGDPKFWSVRDGAITGMTTPENRTPGNTFLIWRGGTLKDFELRLKFRIQGGNSGVQYRSKDMGNWVVGGYQADFEAGDMFTGIIYEERGRGILAKVGEKVRIGEDGKPVVTGSVGDPARIRAAVKKGDWNEYVITARGNHLVQSINGAVTAEAVDEDAARRAMEGILALQLHAGPPMTVQFKDITLKPL